MDRAALEKRLVEVQQAIDQTVAALNVLLGRRNELDFLISELAQGEETSPAAEIGGEDDNDCSESS